MSDKTTKLTGALLIASLVLLSGCLNAVYVASEGARVTTKESAAGTPFSVKVGEHYGVWGLVPPIRAVEVDRVVAEQTGADVRSITGLRITRHRTVLNWVLEAITFGLYNPRTLVIEGRYQ